METKVTRSIRGELQALTTIPLFEVGDRVLQVTTFKSSPGIVCDAQVVQEHDGMITFVIFQDYHKTLVRDRTARATEKNIRSVHAQGLAGIEAVLAEARQQYAVSTLATAIADGLAPTDVFANIDPH